ncbi:MAG: nuclear transport factor 2 family protein [Clostridia bacterium]|nr:nuclear transport factor 2 family protein [Clostridia bacterium]
MDKILSAQSEKAAQGQLDAYNQRDIEAFLSWYTEDVKVYDLDTDELRYKGKEEMRKRYSKTFQNEYLYCSLVNRMVLNRTVIDQESVKIDETDNRSEVIAIYDVNEEGLIECVRFSKGKA